MSYTFHFGSVGAPAGTRDTGDSFRIALLGDFSARANRGEQEAGSALGSRKAHKVDVDNLDDVLARMDLTMTIPVGHSGERVEFSLESMDDFHPDELFDKVEVFEELADLRRQLNSGRWESAAEDLKSWAEEAGDVVIRRKKPKARGSSVPNAKLSDFGDLMSRPARVERGNSDAEELIKAVVAPFIVRARDAAQDELIELADRALSELMRSILHHADFQTVESLWRSVELLVRRLETGRDLQIVLYDVTAEELAADLAEQDDLADSGLYELLVEKPAQDKGEGPLSLIVGCYDFEETPPHAELLGRLAKIAAAANAPFLTGISNDVIRKPDPDAVHAMTAEAWEALRGLPESAYLGLACPRFMLRNPYGKKTDPIEPFAFEEFTNKGGVGHLLWGNGAVFTAFLLGQTFKKAGKVASMRLGAVTGADDMPYHFVIDQHGDQVALPCTDRLLGERQMAWLTTQGFIPVLSVRGAPEARIGAFIGLTGKPLAGPWSDPSELPAPAAPAEPEAIEEDEADTGLGDDAAEESGDEEEMDDELAALLADLEGDDDVEETVSAEDADEDDDEMDPELAALLAELD